MVFRHCIALILAVSALGVSRVRASELTISCQVLFRPYGVFKPFPVRELTPSNRNIALWLHEGNHDFRVGHKLPRSDYLEIKTAALRVLERCPRDCTVVGIGRSPTPITAFIDNYEPGRAINLPLSNFRHHPDLGVTLPEPYNRPGIANSFRPLNPAEEAIIFQHFDEYLLKRLRFGTKEILLLDVSEVGSSLFSAERYIRKFLAARGVQIKVRTYGFTTPYFRSLLKEMARTYGVTFEFAALSRDSHVIRSFNDSRYQNFFESEFGEYTLGQRPEENGIRHDVFVNTLRTHMFFDAELFASASALPVPPSGYYADGITRTIRGISDPSVTANISFFQ